MPFSRERGHIPPPIPFERHELPFDQEPELSDAELEQLLAEHPNAQKIIDSLSPQTEEPFTNLDENDIEEVGDDEDTSSIPKAA